MADLNDALPLLRKDRYKFDLEDEYLPDEIACAQKNKKKMDDLALVWNKKDIKLTVDLIRNGVPPTHRREVWLATSGALSHKELYRGYYFRILSENRGMESPAIKNIKLDINRTFPGHPLLDTPKYHEMLERVLTAYSWRNPVVGYCQSMNFIAAMMLLFLEEEEAFWLLATTIEDFLPPQYYTPDMVDSNIDIHCVFPQLMKEQIPQISKHLESHSVVLPLLTTQWFLCLFLSGFPTETSLRIWDVFYNEGPETLFRAAIALFKMHEDQILRLDDPTSLYTFLTSIPKRCFDHQALIETIYQKTVPINKARVSELRTLGKPTIMKQIREVSDKRQEMNQRKEAAKKNAEQSTSQDETDEKKEEQNASKDEPAKPEASKPESVPENVAEQEAEKEKSEETKEKTTEEKVEAEPTQEPEIVAKSEEEQTAAQSDEPKQEQIEEHEQPQEEKKIEEQKKAQAEENQETEKNEESKPETKTDETEENQIQRIDTEYEQVEF